MRDLDTNEEIVPNNRTSSRIVHARFGGEAYMVSSTRFIKNLSIVVPTRIRQILMGMSYTFKDTEFSIFGKTKLGEDGKFYMEEEFFIPLQEVSNAFVNYMEDNTGYNTVIHKHPDGCHGFSGTDAEYINKNFKFSLLWVDRAFSVAVVNIELEEGVFFQTDLRVEQGSLVALYPKIADTKIIRKQPVQAIGRVFRTGINRLGGIDLDAEPEEGVWPSGALARLFGDRSVNENIDKQSEVDGPGKSVQQQLLDELEEDGIHPEDESILRGCGLDDHSTVATEDNH